MTHLSQDDLRRFRERSMPTDELAALAGHVGECAACAKSLRPPADRENAVARLRLMIDDGKLLHLSYQDLEHHIDGKLKGASREIVEGHLAFCVPCRAEVISLSSFFGSATPLGPATPDAGIEPPPSRQQPRPMPPTAEVRPRTVERPPLRAQTAEIPANPATREPRTREAKTVPPGSIPDERVRRRRALRHQANQWVSIGAMVALFAGIGLGVVWYYILLQPTLSPAEIPRVEMSDSGMRVGVDSMGRLFGVAVKNTQVRDAILSAITSQRYEFPKWMRGLSTQMPGMFSLVSPLGITVESDVPEFRWTGLAGARGYTVSVFNEEFKEVATSEPVKDLEWTAKAPLERGVLYSWRVSARTEKINIMAPKKGDPAVKFRVLSQPDKSELDLYRREGSRSHLAMTVIYLQYGMLNEAARESLALAAENPNPAGVAAKLHRSIDPKTRESF